MQLKEIPLSELIVNPSNDRHGPTATEDTAIMWLFEHKSKEMKKLASRICTAGRIYDAPLVVPTGTKYLVKDGNRRVTCLKLIKNPERAPRDFKNFFANLNREYAASLAEELVCQVEKDLTVADEIIGLRHNGTQGGAGQLMWGPREKATHANRISGVSDYEWPQLVERFLEEHGHATEAAAIKRSTLDRVLNAKKRRDRLGISRDDKGELVSLIAGHDILPSLVRLAEDMRDDKLTLKETLIAGDIDKYLDKLQSDGLLPAAQKNQTTKPGTAPGTRAKRNPRPAKPRERLSLIPTHVAYDFRWTAGQTKIEMAWSQLQFELELKKHKFSIAVLLRTTLELVAKNFINKKQISSKGTLEKDLVLVLEFLKEQGSVEAKDADDIRRLLTDRSSMTSVLNLQRILHSKSQMPSEDDLVTMWDCLEPVIVKAIKSVQQAT